MTDDEVTSGLDEPAKLSYDRLAYRQIEINHNISTEDNVKRALHRVRDMNEIQLSKGYEACQQIRGPPLRTLLLEVPLRKICGNLFKLALWIDSAKRTLKNLRAQIGR